jgi:hypothetical protein
VCSLVHDLAQCWICSISCFVLRFLVSQIHAVDESTEPSIWAIGVRRNWHAIAKILLDDNKSVHDVANEMEDDVRDEPW